jgi:hypothetical protein
MRAKSDGKHRVILAFSNYMIFGPESGCEKRYAHRYFLNMIALERLMASMARCEDCN